jgi:hypothetical protein
MLQLTCLLLHPHLRLSKKYLRMKSVQNPVSVLSLYSKRSFHLLASSIESFPWNPGLIITHHSGRPRLVWVSGRHGLFPFCHLVRSAHRFFPLELRADKSADFARSVVVSDDIQDKAVARITARRIAQQTTGTIELPILVLDYHI